MDADFDHDRLTPENIALFMHEEYWADEFPHQPREASSRTDCEICWMTADRLLHWIETGERDGR